MGQLWVDWRIRRGHAIALNEVEVALNLSRVHIGLKTTAAERENDKIKSNADTQKTSLPVNLPRA
jgi:hypothetical protein